MSHLQLVLLFKLPAIIVTCAGCFTCRGCIPEAMRSLIIRTWARPFGSAGRRRGPGLVSSTYWITASCVGKKPLLLFIQICQLRHGLIHVIAMGEQFGDLLTEKRWCHQFQPKELVAWGLISCTVRKAGVQIEQLWDKYRLDTDPVPHA